jgi:hypothetical protein
VYLSGPLLPLALAVTVALAAALIPTLPVTTALAAALAARRGDVRVPAVPALRT